MTGRSSLISAFLFLAPFLGRFPPYGDRDASLYRISLIISVGKVLLFPCGLIKSPRTGLSLARTGVSHVPLSELVSGQRNVSFSLVRPWSRDPCWSQSVSLIPHDYMAQTWKSGGSHTKEKLECYYQRGGQLYLAGRNKACSPQRSICMLYFEKKSQLKTLSNTYKNIINVFQIRNSIEQIDSNLIFAIKNKTS